MRHKFSKVRQKFVLASIVTLGERLSGSLCYCTLAGHCTWCHRLGACRKSKRAPDKQLAFPRLTGRVRSCAIRMSVRDYRVKILAKF